MTCWEILEIEPTNDKKTVKRAYTKCIRQYRPDEDPEKFQEIREAFDEAMFYVEHNIDPTVPPIIITEEFDEEALEEQLKESELNNTEPEEQIQSNDDESEEEDEIEYTFSETDLAVEKLHNQIWEILDNPDNIRRLDLWKELLNDESLENFEVKNIFRQVLFQAFLEQREKNPTFFRPTQIIFRMIEAQCNWLQSETMIYKYYDEDAVNYVLDPVRKAMGQFTSEQIYEEPASRYEKEDVEDSDNDVEITEKKKGFSPSYIVMIMILIWFLMKVISQLSN